MSKPTPNALGYAVILGAAAFFALTVRDIVKGPPPSELPPNFQNLAESALRSQNPITIRAASLTLRAAGYVAAANALELEAQKYDQAARIGV
jgi:hypothetical protein